jgi:ubiquinone/menaquinone biosynthesis C-methylase UbiE
MESIKNIVLRTNEIYHDLAGEKYEKKHKEIFIDEVDRWQKIGKELLAPLKAKIVILDIGTGTGFVPKQIARFLKKGDVFICSDLSAKILDIGKKEIDKKDYACDFEWIKLDGNDLKVESSSVDFITINSVLHHIPDFDPFFAEINRVLKAGGYLIIGHEPNKKFFDNRFLWINSQIIAQVSNPRLFFIQILKWLRLYNILKPIYLKINKGAIWTDPIFKELNQRLLEEKVILAPMNELELAELVDYHSPKAGRFRKDSGIDLVKLREKYLPNYKLLKKESYNHIHRLNSANKLMTRYDALLKRIFPDAGGQFIVVFKKIN